MIKIGIIKEGKIPTDRRVPFTPEQCAYIQNEYPNVILQVQASDIRCFSDQEYKDQGVEIVADVSDSDILFGVKEVPIPELVSDKTYFFFSHTIKKQPYNKNLLQTILSKNINLVDYECLKGEDGNRVVAFGRFAGIVGAYNAFWTYGQKYQVFDIKRSYQCKDMNELFAELNKVKLPTLKIAVTGGGRVAKGAMEILDALNIQKVSVEQYVNESFQSPVYCQLESEDYNQRKDKGEFIINDFYFNPTDYESTFAPFLTSDLLIAAAYWDPQAPVLFTKEQMQADDFNIKVIADITCDIEGSVPSTIRATTIDDPVYDFNRKTWKEEKAFSNEDYTSVMSVDNLPCELPRDASESFGSQLIANVLPSLLGNDNAPIVPNATITEKGTLTKHFDYLSDYVA